MGRNEKVERTKRPKPEGPVEMPRFDDLLDVLQFAEANDLGQYLESLDEISPQQFNTEKKRRQVEWATLSREKKKLILIGEAVRERLLLLGMRQADLARKLGINRSWVTRVVQGQENLTVAKLCELAEALACDESDFFRERTSDKRQLIGDATVNRPKKEIAPKLSGKIRSNMRGVPMKRRPATSAKIPV